MTKDERLGLAYILASYPATFLCILWTIWLDSVYYHSFDSVNLGVCAIALLGSPVVLSVLLPTCLCMTIGIGVQWAFDVGLLVPVLCVVMMGLAIVAVSVYWRGGKICPARPPGLSDEEWLAQMKRETATFEEQCLKAAEEAKAEPG